MLAKSRKAPSVSSESQDLSESAVSSDYRFESHSQKYRILLPPGSKPPSGYVQVGTRHVPIADIPHVNPPDSYVRLPSGLVVQELPPELLQDDWSPSISDINSPIDSGILSPAEYLLSPREGSPFSDDFKVDTRESGIGSGADSVSVIISPKRNAGVQTDQLPPEFAHIQQGEMKALEDLKAKEEEAARIAQESEALKRREARRNSEDYDAAMGDTVMRYLKMVRRNSKSVDQKKAERFRSMNYDPTLRNIKSKYIHNAGSSDSIQHIGIQCGDSLIKILKMYHTPIEPPREKTKRRKENKRARNYQFI